MKKIISLIIISLLLVSCNLTEENNNSYNGKNNTKKDITSKESKVFSLKTEDISSEVGSITEDLIANDNNSVKAVKGLDKPGSLGHNKSIILNEGEYKAIYSLKLENPDINEVVSGIYVDLLNNEKKGYSKEIYVSDFENSKYNEFVLEFKITKDNTEIMPWVYYNGQATLYLDEINIVKSKGSENFSLDAYDTLTFEEDILGKKTGEVVDDEMAKNKKAVYVEEGKDAANHIAFGPYSKQELPGNHRAAFRIKTSDNKNEEVVAKLEVFNAGGNGVNKSLVIRGTDFEESNKYQNFEINFTRTDKGSMEYRVYYYGITNISLDNVTVIGPNLDSFKKDETEDKSEKDVEEDNLEGNTNEDSKVEE